MMMTRKGELLCPNKIVTVVTKTSDSGTFKIVRIHVNSTLSPLKNFTREDRGQSFLIIHQPYPTLVLRDKILDSTSKTTPLRSMF